MPLIRAYSTIEVKAAQDASGKRTFKGVASTPSVDRMGDVVDPMGMVIKLPVPLLWQHNNDEPIGWITAAKATKSGIEVECEVANVTEDGCLKDRLDEAWQSLKSGLVRGLSIGFNALESARIEGTYGYKYLKSELLELSAVTIPANQDCSIMAIKSIDQKQRRAALGNSAVVFLKEIPGVTGMQQNKPVTIHKGVEIMATIAEQIASFEAKRAASSGRMNTIMTKSGDEGRTLDDAETQEYDGLAAEIKTIDAHITRLKAHEVEMLKTATPVTKAVAADPVTASASRGTSPIITVTPNIDKGIAFTRYVKALAMARGNLPGALAIAEHNKSWMDQTPQVAQVLKTAVAGGDTTSAGWASELVYNQNLVNEFIELLRPQTIIGKMTGLKRVPFNVRMSGQDSGSSANWVGQGKAIPVSKMHTLEVTLGIAKAAGLVILTEELVRSSAPSAEMLVRDDLMKTIATFLDVQFVDPNVVSVANVSPSSVTYGVTPVTPTGTTSAHLRADVQTLFANFITANDDPRDCVWIMDPTMALSISLMQNALGQPVFPGITMNGGEFFGLPVIVSNSANIPGSPSSGHMIILAKASDILFADDGQLVVDASREASIEMTDAPTGNAAAGTAGTTSLVSMFQENSVAIRAVRFVNWKKRRSTAVAYIREAQYVS